MPCAKPCEGVGICCPVGNHVKMWDSVIAEAKFAHNESVIISMKPFFKQLMGSTPSISYFKFCYRKIMPRKKVMEMQLMMVLVH